MEKWRELQSEEDWRGFKQVLARVQGGFLFKMSPICSVSFKAEAELAAWREGLADDGLFSFARVDVIAARALSRLLAAELGVKHESPQVFRLDSAARVIWHADHFAITRQKLAAAAGIPDTVTPS